ncbi:Tim44 domain-containing protein [Solimonas fluminis]|nr:Tim44-like domain-containing protein [Solimonas fluminis]
MQRLSANGILALLLAMLVLAGEEAHARAGGGGGGRGGGGLVVILYPLLLVYAGIVTWLLRRKSREARAALALAARDKAWDPDELKARIEQVFFKVQNAWTLRNQDLARDCMSERLYRKHKLQTDQMIQDGTRNILECVNLSKATIVEIADFRDNAKDRLWACMEGSMIDYHIRLSTGAVAKGSKDKPEDFSELWKFIRTPQGWVLDEIDQSVDLSDLMGFKSIVE